MPIVSNFEVGTTTYSIQDDVAYAHAVTNKGSAFSSGLYKITTNGEGHVTAATAVEKSDITALGVPAQDTTYSNATTSVAGLMSAADKSKLDSITSGAAVTDVQINSTSILSNGVANIPLATSDTFGVMKSGNGLYYADGVININPASAAEIKAGESWTKPIVPNFLPNSVFYGLARAAGDSTQGASSNAVGTYTDTAKAAIQSMLSVAPTANPIFTGSFSHNRKASTTVGTNSFTAGDNCEASAEEAHAVGRYTTASGAYSHAEGNYTTASGMASHAEGTVTVATHADQHVFGEYNVADASSANAWSRGNYVEIVGNGTADNAKSNARALDWAGNEYLDGDLYVNCGADSTGGTKVATITQLPSVMTGATSSAAGTSGLVPTPTLGMNNNYLRGDGTWNQPVVILTYGVSTYQDFLDAFNAGAMIFCRAPANTSDPTDTAYTRYAALSYVNVAISNPSIQFLYYRKTNHTSTSYNNETYTYTLDNLNTWSTAQGPTGLRRIIISGDGLNYNWDTNIVTLTATPFVGATGSAAGTGGMVPAPATTDVGKFLCSDGTWATISGGSGSNSGNGILGVTLASTALTADANGVVNIPAMGGCTSSTAGSIGAVPAPAAGDENKFLAGDGTWKAGGLPMVILSYGNSTWNDFINAYNNNVIVYCRASSNSDPSTGSQTRMAFMAYVNDASSPTEVEFQYYRSVSSHSTSLLGDQVFIYKLNSSGTWSVTTRYASLRQLNVGNGLSTSYSSNIMTINTDKATTSIIKTGIDENYPIVPYNQDAAAFYGLAKAAGDSTQSASSNAVGNYTDDAKAAISTMLGVPQVDDLYVYAPKASYATAESWRLNESDGLCSFSSSYKLVKYEVKAGQRIKVISDDRFQFQSNVSVPSSGTSNRVSGTSTYGIGTFTLTVPQNATYLILSTTITNSTAEVRDVYMWGIDTSDNLRVIGDVYTNCNSNATGGVKLASTYEPTFTNSITIGSTTITEQQLQALLATLQ